MEPIKPKHIEPGMTIGIVSPSSWIKPESLEAGLEIFRKRGYRIEYGKHALDQYGYLAGRDEDRASDLMEMFERDDIDAVICSRGGYGASRLIPYLDPKVFANNPKILHGYSDITVLQTWLLNKTGLVTFYGPMPLTYSREVPQPAQDEMWRALEAPKPLGTLPDWKHAVKPNGKGKVTGKVVGGCLCLMAYGIGTDFEIETEDTILLIEDVDESAYRIDAMLTQLSQTGKLDDAVGFVVGEATRWEKHCEGEDPDFVLNPQVLWEDRIGNDKPMVTGFPFGHQLAPLTLPIGIPAELDSDTGTLTYRESATI